MDNQSKTSTKPSTSISSKDNGFVDSATGQAMLPSLMSPEQEQQFQIRQNKFVGDNSLRDSIRHIQSYDIADQYLPMYLRLSDEEIYYLRFIARFRSVQKLQLLREATLFPEIFDGSRLTKDLHRLVVSGLIWRWSYRHPVIDSNIDVFTLSGNGYRFLETIYGQEYHFHPQNFYRLPGVFHVRFWETVDIYQLLVSLPAYRGSSNVFSGGKGELMHSIVTSPLQVALALKQEDIRNFVFYPALQHDGDSFFQKVVVKWDQFTNHGEKTNQAVNSLPGKQNVLAFYTASIKQATDLTEKLELGQFNFPIIFLVGSIIKKYGVTKAFLAPIRNPEAGKPILQPLELDNIMEEGENTHAEDEA